MRKWNSDNTRKGYAFRDKHGVALTGRNRTGPPCSVGRPLAGALQTTEDDDDRHQPPLLVWPLHYV